VCESCWAEAGRQRKRNGRSNLRQVVVAEEVLVACAANSTIGVVVLKADTTPQCVFIIGFARGVVGARGIVFLFSASIDVHRRSRFVFSHQCGAPDCSSYQHPFSHRSSLCGRFHLWSFSDLHSSVSQCVQTAQKSPKKSPPKSPQKWTLL